MLGDDEVRSLVEELAPELRSAVLLPQPPGFDKWVWFLGPHHMVRVARHRVGRRRMVVERRVLDRLGGRLGAVAVPEVVAASGDGTTDVCSRVQGRALHWREWDHVPDAAKAALAPPMGRAMAALHEAVSPDDVADLELPSPRVLQREILEGLVGRTGSARREDLLRRVLALAAAPPDSRPVVLHNDLGLHNLCLDPERFELRGVFDFGDISIGDPHVDARYDPVFEVGGPGMLAAYEATRGVALSAARQALLHAMAALENLSHSLDHEGPELQARRFGWVDAVAGWEPARYGG